MSEHLEDKSLVVQQLEGIFGPERKEETKKNEGKTVEEIKEETLRMIEEILLSERGMEILEGALVRVIEKALLRMRSGKFGKEIDEILKECHIESEEQAG